MLQGDSRLREIALSGNALGNEAAAVVAELIQRGAGGVAHTMMSAAARADGAGTASGAAFAYDTIDLSDNQIGAIGVGCLGEALSAFAVPDTQRGDDAATADAPPFNATAHTASHITTLALAGNPLGDSGLVELALYLPRLLHLRSLDIGRAAPATSSSSSHAGLVAVCNALAGDTLDADGRVLPPPTDARAQLDPYSIALTPRSEVRV